MNQIINIGPIGVVGRKHAIISNTEAIAKDGLLKEKEIISLKKDLAAQRKITREIEFAKVTLRSLESLSL